MSPLGLSGSQPAGRRIGFSEEHWLSHPIPIFQFSRIQGGSQDVLAVPVLYPGVYCKDTQEGKGRCPGKQLLVTCSGLLVTWDAGVRLY